MKKFLLLILSGILGGTPAFADANRAKQLSPEQKQQIAIALKVLQDSKTLTVKPQGGARFDGDILKVLESEGRITPGLSRQMIVCDGG